MASESKRGVQADAQERVEADVVVSESVDVHVPGGDELDEAADAEAEALAKRRAHKRDRKARAKHHPSSVDAGGQRRRVNEAKRRQRSGNPAKRGTPTRKPLAPPTLADWIGAFRIRTLSMAVASVLLGSSAAWLAAGYHLGLALLALGVALFMQIGVNLANDYSDGVKGTDRNRVGPKRITSSTSVDPKRVRNLSFIMLGLGALCGVALAVWSGQYALIAVGAGCVALAWLYTGGPKPYGYMGLGEVVAFLVFGPIAVLGTMYAMLGRWDDDGIALAIAAGCFSAALMLVNNLRDVETDRASRKFTLPSIIGRPAGRVLYAIMMLVPFGVCFLFAMAFAYGPLVMLLLVAAVPAIIIVSMARTPKDYQVALGLTSMTALLYAIGMTVTFWGGITGF